MTFDPTSIGLPLEEELERSQLSPEERHTPINDLLVRMYGGYDEGIIAGAEESLDSLFDQCSDAGLYPKIIQRRPITLSTKTIPGSWEVSLLHEPSRTFRHGYGPSLALALARALAATPTPWVEPFNLDPHHYTSPPPPAPEPTVPTRRIPR